MQRSATHTATQQFPFRRLNAHLTHMPTSAALPATITPRTRAQTHATRQAPPKHNGPGTSASWRVPPKTAHTYKPRTAHRTRTYSIQTHMPRTLTRRPAQPQPLHTETSLHAHRRTHATHSTVHSSTTPHTTRHHRYLTPLSNSTRQRHCEARASHNATTATPCTCQQALGTQQQQNKDCKSQVTNRKGRTCRTFDSRDTE
jgi:hypothetical protein